VGQSLAECIFAIRSGNAVGINEKRLKKEPARVVPPSAKFQKEKTAFGNFTKAIEGRQSDPQFAGKEKDEIVSVTSIFNLGCVE